MSRMNQMLVPAFLFLLEAVLASSLFVSVAWGLTCLAERQAHRPLRADAEGQFLLTPSKATLSGNLLLGPYEKENQSENFEYHFGRELKEERENRKIVEWTQTEDHLQWQLHTEKPGTYEVEMQWAVPKDEAGSEIEIIVGDQVISTTVQATKGATDWQTARIGTLKLSAGKHTLSIRPTHIAHHSVMNFSQVVLRPLP